MIEVSGNGPKIAEMGQYGTVNRRFMLETMMTRREVCDAVRISYRSFSRIRLEGRGPAGTWIGGKLLFSPSEVKRWMREWTEEPGRPDFGEAA